MVAVVVPSPAKSDDFEATSRTICAPMFSNLSSSAISLATVTPSLVMRGAPYDLSRTTLRPLGPSVTRTALARTLMPFIIRSRASAENFTSLAAMVLKSFSVELAEWGSSGGFAGGDAHFDDPHDVGFLHDQEVFAVDLHLRAGPFAEDDAVADLHVERHQHADIVPRARSD